MTDLIQMIHKLTPYIDDIQKNIKLSMLSQLETLLTIDELSQREILFIFCTGLLDCAIDLNVQMASKKDTAELLYILADKLAAE